MVLAITCNCGRPVLQLDVKVTFLPAKIEDNVYLKTAPGRDKGEKNGEVLDATSSRRFCTSCL